VDGGAPASYALAGLSSITIQGSYDDDTLTVDSSGGVLDLPGGIHFDGGSGSDALQLVKTGGPTITASAIDLGPSSGGGKSTITDDANTQTVFFDNLEPNSGVVTVDYTTTGAAVQVVWVGIETVKTAKI